MDEQRFPYCLIHSLFPGFDSSGLQDVVQKHVQCSWQVSRRRRCEDAAVLLNPAAALRRTDGFSRSTSSVGSLVRKSLENGKRSS